LAHKKLGIGILSFAHGHAGVYCQVMKDFPDVSLVAAWDDNPERGRNACAAYGLEYRSRVEDVLADPRVEAVIVTSETNKHAGLIEQSAAAGKHVLCQKPLATTLADCDRIIAAVKRTGIKFSMGYQMRHDPVNLKMRELVKSGAVGNVAVVRRRHSLNVLLNPDFVNGPTRWHFTPENNVGMFFDDASHVCDWFYWMLGKPVSVTAEIADVVTHVSPDDNGVALFRFARGEIGILLNSSTTVAAIATTEIYGDGGTILQDYGDGPSCAAPRPADAVPLRMIRPGDTSWTEFPIPIPRSQGERLMAVPRPFVDYILGRTDETVTAEEGRVTVEMLVGAYRSASEGRRIHFPIV
jgi:predicted dehydrogenase